MKNSPIAAILMGVLTVSAILSLFLFWSYISGTRNLRKLQPQVLYVQGQRAAFGALVNDLAEYSKTHKDIEPILEAAGFGPNRPAPVPAGVTNRPSGK